MAPVEEEYEETKSYASNKHVMIDSDTESVVGYPSAKEEIDDTDDIEVGLQRGFTLGGLLWDVSWVDNMDLYDNLDD